MMGLPPQGMRLLSTKLKTPLTVSPYPYTVAQTLGQDRYFSSEWHRANKPQAKHLPGPLMHPKGEQSQENLQSVSLLLQVLSNACLAHQATLDPRDDISY